MNSEYYTDDPQEFSSILPGDIVMYKNAEGRETIGVVSDAAVDEETDLTTALTVISGDVATGCESDGETQPIELPGTFSICIERPESGMADGGLSLEELMEASRRLDDEGGAPFRSKMPDEAAAFDPQEPPSRIVPRSTTELPFDLPRIPRIGDVPVAAEPSEGRADEATETEEEALFEPALPPEAPLGGIAVADGGADGAADAGGDPGHALL